MKFIAKLFNVALGLAIVFGIPYYFNNNALYSGTWLVGLFVFMYLDDAIEDHM